MGFYRLFLAFMVLLSHCGYQMPGYNQGVTAVVSFFIISGYVITKLISVKFNTTNGVKYFYIDRCMRLFPQFVFYLVLTSFLYIYFNDYSKINIYQFVVNLTMMPLNTFAVFMNEYIIVPQSWSLGLELQFYALIPFILLSNKKSAAAIVSLLLFIPAYLGFINTDYFGYRMISGTMFIFLIGSMMAEGGRKSLYFLYISSCIMLGCSFLAEELRHQFNVEVLSGIVIGVPVISFLLKMKIRNQIDKLAGDLSYGVYLNHLMFFYVFNKIGLNVISISGVITITACSLIASYATLKIIEQPFYNLRHKKDFQLSS